MPLLVLVYALGCCAARDIARASARQADWLLLSTPTSARVASGGSSCWKGVLCMWVSRLAGRAVFQAASKASAALGGALLYIASASALARVIEAIIAAAAWAVGVDFAAGTDPEDAGAADTWSEVVGTAAGSWSEGVDTAAGAVPEGAGAPAAAWSGVVGAAGAEPEAAGAAGAWPASAATSCDAASRTAVSEAITASRAAASAANASL
mmetsp:Transcript_7638/g.18546  ORF Transcript_7638/g.18546 Transcript_7638/m.18546 type:complete len:209 (+) Transcript_7638:1766-2392(+)